MPIQVTCPSCLTRFSVNEKFAGKKGPCPKCKKEIQVPDKADEIVVHAPETSGPKDSKGKSILKPLRREDAKFSLPVAIGVGAAVVAAFGIAIATRFTEGEPPLPLLAIGAIMLAPPLVFAGYTFLRNAELGAYGGKELLVRALICSAIFPITWLIYWFVPGYIFDDHKSLADIGVVELVFLIPAMIGLGATASLLVFEWEWGQAVLHYMLYLLVTVTLALTAGLILAEPLAPKAAEPANKITAPSLPQNPAAPVRLPTGGKKK